MDRSRLKCRGCAQCARLGVGSWAVDFGQSSFTLKTLKSVLTFFLILPPSVGVESEGLGPCMSYCTVSGRCQGWHSRRADGDRDMVHQWT